MRKIFLVTGLVISVALKSQLYVDYWNEGMKDFEEKNFHGTIINMNKYIEITQTDPNAYYNRAISKINLGDYSGACIDFKLATELGFKTNDFIKYICDSNYKLNILKKQYYKNETLIPENNYRPLYTRKDTLRGALRPERTCFDVFFYDLFVNIIPKGKKIEGENKIYFHVVEPTKKIQIDLFDNYQINAITFEESNLNYAREFNAIFIEFPYELIPGKDYLISVKYSGTPGIAANPPWEGGFVWKKDKKKNHWVGVACEQLGASSWWPNKDHLSDEPDSMMIRLKVPKKYTAVSNGTLKNSFDTEKNSQFEWFVSYPINNYNVTFYMGKFEYFSDTLNIEGENLLMKYYVLPYNLEKAKQHFEQSNKVIEFYSKVFGKYPFMRDGFGLIESPFAGMEHQTAIAYGNEYKNEYHNMFRKKTFDYIIVHEAAHEWWGNAITAKDMADVWIHEGFATYAELLFIEDESGKAEYNYEANNKSRYIFNFWPMVENYDVNENSFASGDVYNKGAMLLASLRSDINNDSMFFDIIKSFFEDYKYTTVTSQQFIDFVNLKTGKNYSSFFEKFLYEEEIPVLGYRFNRNMQGNIVLTYWWEGVKNGFTMPFAIMKNDGLMLRIEGSFDKQEITLENTEWFNFITEWQFNENMPANSFSYYETKWYR